MRDKLIHEYWGVDVEIVWAVIKEELPPLAPLIEKVLRGRFNDMVLFVEQRQAWN